MTHSALVTGASSGIGRAIARALAEEGYDLTISARTLERLAPVVDELKDLGVTVHPVAANLASEEDLVRLFSSHAERFGRLDVLVNNAGMGIRGPIDNYPTKHLDLQVDINFKAVVLAYREAMGMLRAAGQEHRRAWVINTASISGKVGEPGLGVYAAVKHAVVGFTDSMNRELHTAGIRSCVLCPGYVDTPLSDFAKEYIPPEEMISTRDLAETVRFLLRLSPATVIPEVLYLQGDGLGDSRVPPPSAVAGTPVAPAIPITTATVNGSGNPGGMAPAR